MTPSVKQMRQGTCGCGRSPTGDCCGWHSLTEEQYKESFKLWKEKQKDYNVRNNL
jgi:hypothetical protein